MDHRVLDRDAHCLGDGEKWTATCTGVGVAADVGVDVVARDHLRWQGGQDQGEQQDVASLDAHPGNDT